MTNFIPAAVSVKQSAKLQYEIAELEPDIPPTVRRYDGGDLYKLTLFGYQMYKRAGHTLERKKRNIPIYIQKSFLEFLEMTPVYFLTRDLGMAYCFHRMDYIQLKGDGYANSGSFGITACIQHDLFKKEKLRLGPKFSILDRPPEEREILRSKEEIAEFKKCRETTQLPGVPKSQKLAELEEYLDNYDSDDEYDSGSEAGIIKILKFHRACNKNIHSHGFAVYYDEYKHRHVMVRPRGKEEKTYVLYLIPGRDECIEINLEDTKTLCPSNDYFIQLGHFGLSYLFYHINRIGQSFPKGRGFKYVLIRDRKFCYRKKLVDQIGMNGYNSATQKYTVALNMFGEHRAEQYTLSAWIIDQLQSLERPLQSTTKAEMSAEGYQLYSEHEPVPTTRREPTPKCIQMPTVLVDPTEDITFEDYIERVQEINQELEENGAKDGDPNINRDTKVYVATIKSNMRRMLDLVFEQILEQNQPENKKRIMDLKLEQLAALKKISSENRMIEMERRPKHLKYYDLCARENQSIERTPPTEGPAQSFLSRDDAEKLWMEGELILQKTREEYVRNRRKGYAPTAVQRAKTSKHSYYIAEGVPRLAEMRLKQIHKHQFECSMKDCQH